MLGRACLRVSIFVVPLVGAAWAAGCSSSDSGGGAPANDAGPDIIVEPAIDSGADASTARDCTADIDPDGLAKHLDCTGLYDDYAQKTIRAGVTAYTPGLVFWSDGAEKSRWLYLPPGTKIDDSDWDNWIWPNGTKVWKEFRLDGKRVETRLFQKGTDGTWKRTTYRWNADETDAERKELGEKVPIAGKPSYEIPATGLCDQCHAGRKDQLLGLEAIALGVTGASGVTLATLDADGMFSTPPPHTSYTIPDDPSITAGKAPLALGWLHVNCGICHNPSPSSTAFYTGEFFRIDPSMLEADGGILPDARNMPVYQTAVCVDSTRTNPDAGVPYKRIAGGDPGLSLASILSGERAPEGETPTTQTQMPPLVTHQVDAVGHGQLDDWITALPACP